MDRVFSLRQSGKKEDEYRQLAAEVGREAVRLTEHSFEVLGRSVVRPELEY